MISIRRLSVVFLALGLSACVSAAPPASRGTAQQVGAMSVTTSAQNGPALVADKIVLAAQYDVEAIRVSVPRKLKVSEANTIKPIADIVWRGEPVGDRHAQVAAIFNEAIQTGTATMTHGRQVIIDVEVTKFHALTERTRYTIGGMHEMRFVLTVTDAVSGAIIEGPREVVADIKASGGAKAIAEEQAGRTQRVVTLERLSQVIRRELSAPVSQDQLISRLKTGPLLVTE